MAQNVLKNIFSTVMISSYFIHYIPKCVFFIFKGLPVTEDDLKSVTLISGVLTAADDYLKPDFRLKCDHLCNNPDVEKSKDYVKAYLTYLKDNGLTQM